MIISKPIEDSAFVWQLDAQSRVAVWAANHLNSRQISKLGLTHVSGGAADSSGRKILHGIWSGLTLERQNSIMPPGQIPYQHEMIPTTALATQQMGYDSVLAPLAIPQFFPVSLCNIPQIISEMTGEYDTVYVAEKLGLFQWDVDKITGPKICRCFCDLTHLVDGFNFACFNASGGFKVRFVLFGNSMFEVKWFKYTDSPGIGYFPFVPSVSAVYVPWDCDGTFTTNANMLLDNSDMGWLCTADGIEKLDWEIIRRFGENARLVWPIFQDEPLLTRNQFAEAFAIVTESRRKKVDMKILRAEATVQLGNMWAAQESLLDDREIKKLARKYGLEIDPIWNGLPGEVDFDDAPPVRAIPPFWTGNRIAVFFGKTSGEFMQEFVIRRLVSWIVCGRVLVVVDEKDRKLARKVYAAGGDKVTVASFEVFKDEHVFLEKAPQKADMIFIVPPRDDSEMKLITPEILDACAQAELPVGIFSRSEDAPQQETASDTVLYCVSKSKAAEDVFSVKNMSSMAIIKYKFSSSGVEETPGTEDEMSKGE